MGQYSDEKNPYSLEKSSPGELGSAALDPGPTSRRTVRRSIRAYVAQNISQIVRKREKEFDLIERIHEAESEFLDTPLDPAHVLTVSLEPDTFTDEKYDVFENYQRVVHQEPPEKTTPSGFKRFLCSSPLQRRIEITPDGKEKKLGSYHQCYRIDGRLVAIVPSAKACMELGCTDAQWSSATFRNSLPGQLNAVSTHPSQYRL